MLKFPEFHYTNSLYLYRHIDGYGERLRASGASIFYSFGACLLALNLVQQFTGSLGPLWRQLVPVIYRPGLAEFMVLAVISIALNYYWLWRRTPLLESRYSFLRTQHKRWLAPAGSLLGVGFFVACMFALDYPAISLPIVGLILVAQELLYYFLRQRLIKDAA
jgi:hypothetical protein